MLKNKQSKHFDYIDIFRVLLCISVLLYHLGLLKGGFFAVCGFFTLSGYFMFQSLDKEDFSLKDHYIKRFKSIYLPLIVTVFVTLLACNIYDVFWVTMKPEVTSILGGYNNYYCISVDTDYFARADESPFLHLWYISIIIQLELLIPFIYFIFRKTDKNKSDMRVISLFLLIVSFVYSYVAFTDKGLTDAYYGTPERIYPFFAGMFIYYIVKISGTDNGNKLLNNILFFVSLGSMAFMAVCLDAESRYISEWMLLFTILSCVCIISGIRSGNIDSILFKPIKWLSSFSYEIYLIHFPVMVIFNSVYFDPDKNNIFAFYIFCITVAISFFIHVLLKVNERSNPLLILSCVTLGFLTVYGGVLYAVEKDHTKEMELLRTDLAVREQEMAERQQEYLLKLQDENDEWNDILSIYADEDYAEKRASSEQVCGIGDSIMLGASFALYEKFDNFYIDAAVSRPGLYTVQIMDTLRSKGILTNTVLIHLGSNGGLWDEQMYDIVNYVNKYDIQLFWLTVTNNRSYSVYCNEGIREKCAQYDNIHLIDWESLSYGHSSWFVEDRVHMTQDGAYMYAKYIYEAIHGYYLDKYEKERQEILHSYDEHEESKYSFYGNDLLLSLTDHLSGALENASFSISDNKEDLLHSITKDAEDKLISRNVVIAIDGSIELNEEDLERLTQTLEGSRLYIVSFGQLPEVSDIIFIKLSSYSEENKDLFHSDRIHLSEKGVVSAGDLILDTIYR